MKYQSELLIKNMGEHLFGRQKISITQVNSYSEQDLQNKKILLLPFEEGYELKVRNRQQGDFIFLQNGQRKSLKNFFVDEKISVFARPNVPLIFYNNVLVWIVGYRKNYYNLKNSGNGYLKVELV